MSEIIGAVLKIIMALLGVTTVITIGYSAIQNNHASNHLIEIVLLSSNVQTAVQRGPFTNLTTATVIAGQPGGRLAPDSMISGAGLVNPWSGAVTVAVDPSNASRFIITTNDVSTNGCVTIASKASAVAVSVGGSALTLPIDEPSARTACGASNSNTVALTFGH